MAGVKVVTVRNYRLPSDGQPAPSELSVSVSTLESGTRGVDPAALGSDE
jgi:hypothetical protein